MNKGSVFYRWLFYGAAAGLFLLVQALLCNRLHLWGVHPFLPPVLAAVAAVWEDRQESLCAAAVFGLLCDLTTSPPFPAFYTVLFALTALLAGLIAKYLIMPGFFCALTASAAALVLHGVFHALALTTRGVSDLTAAAVLTGRETLLTLPLVPLVYLLFRAIHRRFPAE